MVPTLRNRLRASAHTLERLAASSAPLAALEAAAQAIAAAIGARRKVLVCGNGGSAADAQHLATELVVRLSAARERRALPAIALTTDTSLLTACANDYGFEHIFERQIEALGRAGDVLIGISTSGNSANVVRAFERARERGLATVLFSGRTGGKLKALADHAVCIDAADTAHIQEAHLACYHALCYRIEELLFDAHTA